MHEPGKMRKRGKAKGRGLSRAAADAKLRLAPPPEVDLDRVVIGLGAQKSGTTWLAAALSKNKGVYMRRKEVHYWDSVRAPYIKWDHVAGLMAASGADPASPFGRTPFDHGRYLPYLDAGRRDQRIVAEITPAYALCTQATFADMKAVHEDVRFVFLMRDPVSRLWSGLRHKMRAAVRSAGTADWLERMFLEACDNPHDPDFRRSRYDETLRALDGAGCNVWIGFYETLFSEDTLADLSGFLGLPRLEGEFGKRVNPGAGAELRLGDAARDYGRKALGETYDYVSDQIGRAHV